MRKELNFFRCSHCGNIVYFFHNSGVPVQCCGENMTEISPNTSDGAGEKHVPVVTQEGNKVTVKVGSVDHPMTDEHWIQWIALLTEKGMQAVELSPGNAPVAEFSLLDGDKVVAAYEYCNLHSLWKA